MDLNVHRFSFAVSSYLMMMNYIGYTQGCEEISCPLKLPTRQVHQDVVLGIASRFGWFLAPHCCQPCLSRLVDNLSYSIHLFFIVLCIFPQKSRPSSVPITLIFFVFVLVLVFLLLLHLILGREELWQPALENQFCIKCSISYHVYNFFYLV